MTHLFSSNVPQIHPNNHATFIFQHLSWVDFNKPWALDSQNTIWSLQSTSCHCIIHKQITHLSLPQSHDKMRYHLQAIMLICNGCTQWSVCTLPQCLNIVYIAMISENRIILNMVYYDHELILNLKCPKLPVSVKRQSWQGVSESTYW